MTFQIDFLNIFAGDGPSHLPFGTLYNYNIDEDIGIMWSIRSYSEIHFLIKFVTQKSTIWFNLGLALGCFCAYYPWRG